MSLAPGANAAEQVQQVIGQTASLPVPIGSLQLEVNLNCGFAVREPGDTSDQVALLRNADAALLTAKASESNVVQFSTDMSFPSVGDAARRTELVNHVTRDDFEFYFQPEVDLASGKVVGAEALLRLWLPDGSVAPAYTFIDDVERLHVIDLLTPKLLATSRRLAEEIDDPAFTIRINLSGEQICNKEALEAIAAVNSQTSVRWCIEITERTIVEANSKTLKQLRRLVDNGVTLALDDFGTGYSSFSELANLPISAIKIDRSFIEPLTPTNAHASLASVIFDVARRLSLDVVAEGIETEDQRRALSSIGCNQGQGWLFGKAVPLDDFVATSRGIAPRLTI